MKYVVKELKKKHITPGLFTTLAHLSSSTVNNLDKGRKQFKIIKKNKNHRIFVALDKATKEVIGLITLLIEPKFIHDCGKMGHIEDVVVREGFEGRGVGGALVQRATDEAKKEGCYRIRLFCSDRNVSFYEKAGFKRHENGMQIDLRD
ncbi:MAG: GNAT family N-acetyltransferase [Patescibacteria group bacterium]